MTDIDAIIKGTIRRACIKSEMLPTAIDDFVEMVVHQYALDERGKVRSTTTGKSPKKAVRAAMTTRPEIFKAEALAKIKRPDALFNPANASKEKRSTNPYRWSQNTPEAIAKRDAAIVALVSRQPTKFCSDLARAAGCAVSGRPLIQR